MLRYFVPIAGRVSGLSLRFTLRPACGCNLLTTVAQSPCPSANLYQIRHFRGQAVEPKWNIDEFNNKVLDVCKKFHKLDASKISLESHFMKDLGLDSLDHVEVIMAVEEEFGVEISDADAEKLITPQAIATFLHAMEWADGKPYKRKTI